MAILSQGWSFFLGYGEGLAAVLTGPAPEAYLPKYGANACCSSGDSPLKSMR